MNENKSFIKLYKKILEWEWYKDYKTKDLFIHLLLKANWKDGKYQGYEIPRGSLITGRKQLAEELGFTEQSIRTAINHLKSTNEITIKTTKVFSIITIVNYEQYQESNQVSNQQLTNNQPTTNQQLTTIEEYKNNRIKENNNIINIYEFVEQNFGRLLSPVEYEEISSWNDNELTRYAIKQAVLNNKCSTKYISRILNAYERENIKSVQQAQEREREYVEARKYKSTKKTKEEPVWLNQQIEAKEATKEEIEEIERMLEEYRMEK